MGRERSYPPPDHGIVMTNEMEGEENGVPYGLLMWGQAGVYNAVDDRMVIAALADSAVGVVRPTRLTAGPGLQVSVRAGWLAVASADDGTNAVVGSRQTHTLTVPAGGSSTVVYHVWIDTDPDNGRWHMNLVPQGTTVGRAGVSIGRITVPAGANLASQMTFSSLVPTLGRHADAVEITNSTTSLNRMTPHYPIAPYQVKPARLFRVNAWGRGWMGPTVHHLRFRGSLGSSPIVEIRTVGWVPPQGRFDWEAQVEYQFNQQGTALRSHVRAIVTRHSSSDDQAGWTQPDRSVAATKVAWGGSFSPQWAEIQVQAGFTGISAGQSMTCYGSTFDTFEPYID